jgi:hypothetical protein
MKLLIAGDWHGEPKHATKMVREAKKAGVKRILQLGDFGLWDHLEDGVRFLDVLNSECRKEGVIVYALGGNHENWTHWNWYVDNMPKDENGFAYLRSHILLAPKIHYFRWNGKTWLIVGGAVSVDRDLRVTGVDWWPDEITPFRWYAHVNDVKVDYLLTHDCSNKTPWKGRLKPDLLSQENREKIDGVLKKSRPNWHFHGHMHAQYAWENLVADNHYTKTIGLDMNGTMMSWGILDTEAGEFLFRNKFPVQWNGLGT